jgi:hypothetical protein
MAPLSPAADSGRASYRHRSTTLTGDDPRLPSTSCATMLLQTFMESTAMVSLSPERLRALAQMTRAERSDDIDRHVADGGATWRRSRRSDWTA